MAAIGSVFDGWLAGDDEGRVDGDTSAAVLTNGQVVGVIDDLPTGEGLIDRVVTETPEQFRRTHAYPR